VRFARLLIPLALLAVFLTSSSSAALRTPTGLHGFLLSANEPLTHTFHRTPAFAWRPTPGADHYELQLATDTTFRENSILYDDSSLQTPVAAAGTTLPWISGSPYAMYARVRAIFADGNASPWSKDFGFNVLPPAAPTPLPSQPGLLRWSQVDGASGYQVWMLDSNKIEPVNTNVLDEREYYTFHSASWYAAVHWRVRAVRDDMIGRINGMPAAKFGPWSQVYTTTNPALVNAPIRLGDSISDVVSDGSRTSSAHELMPGFTWTGDEGLSGTPATLFRVYVFTDDTCLNPVFTSSVVGSPAYAPRIQGSLAMPQTSVDVTTAQSSYLGDGAQGNSFSLDGQSLSPTEDSAAATPTTSIPGASSGNLTIQGNPGSPVDLWDVNWPSAGYFWTVVPVVAVGAGGTSVINPGAQTGATVIPVNSSFGFTNGDQVTIGVAPNADSGKVVAVGPGSITIDTPLKHDHPAGDPVTAPIRYIDGELPQDACAAGRIQRFGISSAPSLTTGAAPYATGLSSKGRLISSVNTKAFYGAPLVSWTPAPGARAYEVQWSKTRYPFSPQTDPRTNGPGYLTMATSAILPLRPGTWWYRVRGFDYNLPTNAQQMAWSTPARLTVAKPTYRVSGTHAKHGKFKVVHG